MKPCSNNRKLIAWLALGVLDAHQERSLRAHLETCQECRRYRDEISDVTEKLAAVKVRSDVWASETFHQKLAGKLRAEASVPFGETALRHLRKTVWNWRKENETANHSHHRTDTFSRFSLVEARPSIRPQDLTRRRLAFSLIGATALVIAGFFVFLWRPRVPAIAPAGGRAIATSTAKAKSDLDPTISRYQMVANRSLENLDELLTRQGNWNSSSTPIYTVSTPAGAAVLE